MGNHDWAAQKGISPGNLCHDIHSREEIVREIPDEMIASRDDAPRGVGNSISITNVDENPAALRSAKRVSKSAGAPACRGAAPRAPELSCPEGLKAKSGTLNALQDSA